jgi:glycosyltransferase involved in cell wall biosynthesis
MNVASEDAEGSLKSHPTISIAMTTCNGARFVEEQLKSLARQTLLPSELVVCDDRSSDATLDIVRAFAMHAPFPIRVESNPERLGFKANFLKAANLCQSDLIAFSDQDDIWLPHKLEVCVRAFEDQDTLLVYHNATVVTESLDPIGDLTSLQAPPRALNPPLSIDPWLFPLGFSMMFRRSLLRFTGLWPRSVYYHEPDTTDTHDLWFFFLASCLGDIRYISEPLVLYRQHQSNVNGWASPINGLKWKSLMSSNATASLLRERAAEARASLMESMQPELDEEQRHRAKAAAVKYRELAAIYGWRRQIHESDSFVDRLSALSGLVNAHGYRRTDQWGLGPKALMKDLVRTVVPIKGKT